MFSEDRKKVEWPVCAAIWFKNGEPKMEIGWQPTNIDSGFVVCGWRHGCIFPLVKQLLGEVPIEHVQGFLTSKNRFVDRVEALEMFKALGGKPEFPDELYSEDLY